MVSFLSWRYRDPQVQLAQRLGAKPAHCYYGPVGGESPIRYLHEAAQRIARGECEVAVIAGAEAQSTATKAERAGVKPRWTPFATDVEEPKRGAAFQKPLAVKLGVFRPITVYPLYESATSAHWGQIPARGARRVRRAVVDLRQRRLRQSQFLVEETLRAGADHHTLAREPADCVALHQADGGQPEREHGRRGADDVLAKARAAGVPEEKLVYPLGGAAAEEPRDYLLRDQFYESHPQNAVLTR